MQAVTFAARPWQSRTRQDAGAERECVAAWLEREAALMDESGFESVSLAISASAYREAAEAIRSNMLEARG